MKRTIQRVKAARPAPHAAAPIRLLTAVPICDGHDSAINTVNLEFIRAGFEVVYLGYHRSARDIARAAVQEDVRAVGLSSYNGGHVEFFAEVVALLREQGAGQVGVFGGGGGTITQADAAAMRRKGVGRIFFPGTSLDEMVEHVRQTYGAQQASAEASGARKRASPDRRLAELLTTAEMGDGRNGARQTGQTASSPRVIGVTGPGGAGKTTLIDELVLRFLKSDPASRVAVLSHDPSIVGNGALLGDRATMIYSQSDRVYMRSLASRGEPGGLSAATRRCLRVLTEAGEELGGPFGTVIVETVGIGQEALPFRDGLVDQTVLVMSPGYGSRLQLQKIVMLDAADVVVVNKSDLSGAPAASSEIEHRLAMNHRGQKVVATVAKRHRDAGVDELFQLINAGEALTPSPRYSGERAAERGPDRVRKGN
jgi:methylmalonyl-CoA mutase